MAKEITSNEWHLRGVSLETRNAVAALAKASNRDQGVVVDELLRKAPELQAALAMLKSLSA